MKKTILLYLSLAVFSFLIVGCIELVDDPAEIQYLEALLDYYSVDYDVVYNVELKDSCVKFEDAMSEVTGVWEDDELCQDGAVEADVFKIELDAIYDYPEVTVKVGKDRETLSMHFVDLDPGPVEDPAIMCVFEELGVTVMTIATNSEGTLWYILVAKEPSLNTKPVSQITFCFEGSTVLYPTEGTNTVWRGDEESILYPTP